MKYDSQKTQEGFYQFPYHYITTMPPRFGVSKVDGWHLNYVSALVFLLKRIASESPVDTIVDIGCGDGRLTRELMNAFPAARVTGIDYSTKAISLARAMNCDTEASFEARDLLEHPVSLESDIAVLMEVYEHIEPSVANRFLAGVSMALRKGGVLHLTVPHANCPVSAHHFRHFDEATIRRELSEHFEVTCVLPFERISSTRRWINRLLVNRYFVLNHQPTLNRVFAWYMRNLFECRNEGECQRLYVRAVRR